MAWSEAQGSSQTGRVQEEEHIEDLKTIQRLIIPGYEQTMSTTGVPLNNECHLSRESFEGQHVDGILFLA